MTGLLLDTHVFLWWCAASPRLGREASEYIEDVGNTVFVSVASALEIAIKERLGKLRIADFTEVVPDGDVGALVEACGFQRLSLAFRHAHALSSLPRHHNDPFDHMMIAQAQVERLTLVTHDEAIRPYDVEVVWT